MWFLKKDIFFYIALKRKTNFFQINLALCKLTTLSLPLMLCHYRVLFKNVLYNTIAFGGHHQNKHKTISWNWSSMVTLWWKQRTEFPNKTWGRQPSGWGQREGRNGNRKRARHMNLEDSIQIHRKNGYNIPEQNSHSSFQLQLVGAGKSLGRDAKESKRGRTLVGTQMLYALCWPCLSTGWWMSFNANEGPSLKATWHQHRKRPQSTKGPGRNDKAAQWTHPHIFQNMQTQSQWFRTYKLRTSLEIQYGADLKKGVIVKVFSKELTIREESK